MKDYIFKITNISASEILWLQDKLRFFIKRDVKCTFYKKKVYIHLDDDKCYSVLNILLKQYDNRGMLDIKQNVRKWWNHRA